MLKNAAFLILVLGITISSCKKSEDDPAPSDPFTSTTPYAESFKDANGDTTVDRTNGRTYLRMMNAINAYMRTSSGTGTAVLDASVMQNMYANSGSPFISPYTDLNASSLSLKSITALSLGTSAAQEVRDDFDGFFDSLATASVDVNTTASSGQAGKLAVGGTSTSAYLVDDMGIEWAQVIAKGFMGAIQLDYIGNVLLSDDSLNTVDNTTNMAGKNYTKLEHYWDVAYGLLTAKQRYAMDATESSNGGESFLGSYIWEYNKEAYPKMHLAFLKGRRAIANNNISEAKKQAEYIRKEFEKTIAAAALGYLGKWKTGTTDAARAHAIGEGLGFIYSLRFCKENGGTVTFSDQLIDDLIYSSSNGFWDLTNDKINAAIDDIETQFGL